MIEKAIQRHRDSAGGIFKILLKIRVFLKYDINGEPAIINIQRSSKPGRRVYVDANEIPRVLDGLGIAILTTSKGVISNKVAKKLNVGGEIICTVW